MNRESTFCRRGRGTFEQCAFSIPGKFVIAKAELEGAPNARGIDRESERDCFPAILM